MFDYSKLRGKIIETYRTMSEFADELGVSKQTLSKKLNNKQQWSSAEILVVCKLLKIEPKHIHLYFFKELKQ